MKKFLMGLFCVVVVVAVINGLISSDEKPGESGRPVSGSSAADPLPSESWRVRPTSQPILVFDDLITLRDYLYGRVQRGVLETSFRYTGEKELSGSLLARMLGADTASLSVSGEDYRCKLNMKAGYRIVRAWESGDFSGLSEDERTTMQLALKLVAEAEAGAETLWEVERRLHDLLIQQVSYYTEEEKEGGDRFLSVVGALMDGRANCQGYADAFYTVASLAGFQAGTMSVDTPDGGHRVSTICLEEKWYIVDVTFDDSDEGPWKYKLFNAGMDMVKEYWWDEEMEVNPIAETTDPRWYYYDRFGIAYNSFSAFAAQVAKDWSAGKGMEFLGLVRGVSDGAGLKEALSGALRQTGKGYSYQYWHTDNGEDCFFLIRFEKK